MSVESKPDALKHKKVASNLVKLALGSQGLTDGPVHLHIHKGEVPNDFYRRLFKEADQRLKQLDAWSLTSELIKLGVNPVDMVIHSIHPSFPWRGGGTKFVPSVFFIGNLEPTRFYPDFSTKVEELDQLLRQTLDMESHPTPSEADHLGLPLKHPKARLFGFVMSGASPVPYMCFSPLMRECLEHWSAELQTAPREYQAGVVAYFHEFGLQLGNYAPEHPSINQDYRTRVSEFLLAMAKGICASGYSATPETLDANTSVHKEPVLSEILSKPQYQELCKLFVDARIWPCEARFLGELYDTPDEFAETLMLSGASQERAEQVLRGCLMTDIIFRKHDDLLAEFSHKVAALRRAFLDVGYNDIVGSQAMDALAVDIDLGEHFNALGYLRHEDMALGRAFCSRATSSRNQQVFPTDEYLARKVALAIALNQRELLSREMEDFFARKNGVNTELVRTDKCQLMILTSGLLDLKSLLRTHARLEKAIQIGIPADLVLNKPGFERASRAAERFLQRDLGL
ncbi:hypothetical protein [Pseudomonas sp. S1(2024)]|uniref:hypothetical protein n=1 Tax=Pseudomonas sp. S1(2024) TaxID=3390191 RepID=UPI003978E019